jgi:hypothetical protein
MGAYNSWKGRGKVGHDSRVFVKGRSGMDYRCTVVSMQVTIAQVSNFLFHFLYLYMVSSMLQIKYIRDCCEQYYPIVYCAILLCTCVILSCSVLSYHVACFTIPLCCSFLRNRGI